jgi:small subunit ribosomal protein S11
MADLNTTTSKASSKKKQRRSVPAGQLHVQATFNNTIVTFSDKKGNVLSSSSAGASGFRGSKKGTAYAAQVAAEKVADAMKNQFSTKSVDVFVNGVGLGRDSAIRAMSAFNISIDSIQDITGVPHGGVRPRKARRA